MSENEEYDVLEHIGRGSFGVIRKVRRKNDGHILCRKEINYVAMSDKEKAQLHAEFQILSTLRHPNIVAYYHREHLKGTQELHLYMEYCGNGDLSRVIKDLKARNKLATEEFVWSIFTQLVTALYRCHYGVDPPDVGRDFMKAGDYQKPPTLTGDKIKILHRDLKPENVFLGADNSVKLGDFGLSKIMAAHDFASTYVGTPFYMSPEICAAERYTLHSDIWALGCIIYELCTKEPPFNARTHFQLVEKIKSGRYSPLPHVYSPELSSVISKCLQVNPNKRPDTIQLLNMPVVRLMRKEREVVDLGRTLKSREDVAMQKLKEIEVQLRHFEAEKEKNRNEVEDKVRREWEVKARLEIDRLVQLEVEKLRKQFEQEVQAKVDIEIERRMLEFSVADRRPPSAAASDHKSSVSTNGDTDFPSQTDLSSLSLDSPVSQQLQPQKRGTRTPFGRSQTMFVGSPMDIHMAEPSPISIASLSLSPRRTGSGKNIFAAAAENRLARSLHLSSDDEEDDGAPIIPSPTQQKTSASNPFKAPARPNFLTQKTAPQLPKLNPQPNIFAMRGGPGLRAVPSQPDMRPPSQTDGILNERKRNVSPNRRLSKIPSSTNLLAAATVENGSPTRKPSKKATVNPLTAAAGNEDIHKAVIKSNMMKGRTLVELAQARAGGRPVSFVEDSSDSGSGNNNVAADLAAGRMGVMKKRQTMAGGELKFATRMAMAENSREVAMWDPERDEMPSPFLARAVRGVRRF